jgi:imidazolonepropionase-like amidohydrolase/ectoine hydroxylase-related dioxygenase (phytanoyl-CoA dioxygenase family)
MPSDSELADLVARDISAATVGMWRLSGISRSSDGVVFEIHSDGIPLRLHAFRAAPPARWYREMGGVAFSIQTPGKRPLAQPEERMLERTLDALRSRTASILATIRSPPQDAPEPQKQVSAPDRAPTGGFPTARQQAHLDAPFSIPDGAIESYRRDGYVVLRGVLDPAVVEAARPALLAGLERHWPREGGDQDRLSAYSPTFVQVTNVGLEDPAVRAFTHAQRIGRIAAALMGVSGVRIYCEDWLLKRPGEDATGWHQDACVFPLEMEASITAWIPIQAVPPEMGLVRYAVGSQELGPAGLEQITVDNDRQMEELIARKGWKIAVVPPFALGDVCFHNGLTIHGATANTSSQRRDVLALHMFADGARVREPVNATMRHQLQQFGPGLKAGDPAVSPYWPLITPDAGAGWGRLRATALPEGRERDLWVHDGVLKFEGPSAAPWLAPPGGYLLSGLVDCHAHLSWPHNRSMPSHTAEFMNANRRAYAALGTTLLRDMGSDRDDVCRLKDEPGLPPVQASGMMILREDRWPLTNTPPEKLKTAMLARIAAGARWVKVFADFSSDFQGRDNPGFAENDALTYPLEILRDAVRAVHEAGGRVASHCYSRPGAEVSIAAGIDSLEHGWGLDEALIDRMVAAGTAWIPLVGLTPQMYDVAAKHGDRRTIDWISAKMETMRRTIPLAVDRGVRVVAGTDWFPNPTVADEVMELHALGLPAETALACGTWGARKWLGVRGIEDGARADLVLYREDPRRDLSALRRPGLIVIGGQQVSPAAGQARHHRMTWAEIRASR